MMLQGVPKLFPYSPKYAVQYVEYAYCNAKMHFVTFKNHPQIKTHAMHNVQTKQLW